MCPRENNRSHPLSFKGLACLSIFVNFCFFAQTRVTASQWGLMFTVSLHWPVKKKIIKNLSAEHWPSLCAARHFLFQMTALFHRCSQEMFDMLSVAEVARACHTTCLQHRDPVQFDWSCSWKKLQDCRFAGIWGSQVSHTCTDRK